MGLIRFKLRISYIFLITLFSAIWFLLNGKVPGLVSLREADVALNVDAISPWQGLLLEVFGGWRHLLFNSINI